MFLIFKDIFQCNCADFQFFVIIFYGFNSRLKPSKQMEIVIIEKLF